MNKPDLIAAVVDKVDLPVKDVDRALQAMFDTITDAMLAGERVFLVGFGSFYVKEVAAHRGRDFQSGEEIEVPPLRVPKFKAGKHLQEALSKWD